MSSNWQVIFGKMMDAAVVAIHIETCKECRKRYREMLKHAQEEADKDAKKMPV